jgi:hypothetical protein
MSFPSTGVEGAYRNRIDVSQFIQILLMLNTFCSLKDVAKFFDEKHREAYRVYNLCSQ